MNDDPRAEAAEQAAHEELIEAACRASHDAYEVAATRVGWDTNPRSQVPWEDVPDANKVSMRAGIAAALDVAVPIIRADEREQVALDTAAGIVDPGLRAVIVDEALAAHEKCSQEVHRLNAELDAAKARTVEWMDRYTAQVEAERQSMADLRAKVMGLRDRGLGTVLRSDVLALFDEEKL